MPSPVATVRRLPDAAAWLAATTSLRGREPIMTNVMGSVAANVAAGTGYEHEVWLVVEATTDGSEPAGVEDAIVGCAMRTAPWPAVLSPLSDDAAAALGAWLARNDPQTPGLTGPADSVTAVAHAMGRQSSVRMRNLVRVLGTPQPPAECDGEARTASARDLDLLIAWFAAFHSEAHLTAAANADMIRAQVADHRLWVWDVGEPVAMAGHARMVPTPGGTVGRIGPVYTPPEHRRRGYASALTYAIAVELSARCDQVMLFTDAANPASNSVYEKLGFAVIGDTVEATLG